MLRILLFISIVPVYLIGLFIYKKDSDKEPKAFLRKLFLGGIGSCFLALALTLILGFVFPLINKETTELNLFELILYVFIGVALVEEFSKWIITYKISYKNENFDQIYDMIVYAVFVSLGFACFENIIYVLSGGVGVGILRAIFAIPGHAFDGVYMGYFLGKAKKNNIEGNSSLEKKYIFLSILVPTLLHGIYDYCIFSQKTVLVITFFIYVILMYILSIRKIKKISKENLYLEDKQRFCGICGAKLKGIFCHVCGKKIN